ncbi:MAG: helix-turn-helix domain-containing protein [Treponemataceae bacterium]|nr:helix-turn-helix domain-containing protein [Treponemataceae bacterium]
MNGKSEKASAKQIIAKNVKKYRKLNNLTQEQLAEAADVSNTYIANIECGHTWISDKTLEKIATSLHIELYQLFIEENENTEHSENNDRAEIIKYLTERENEISKYIKSYFSETFKFVMQKS